jgi:hypothetical protein
MSPDISISRKAVLISENKRAFLTLRGALGKHGIEFESGYLNLHSLPMIKKIIAKTGSTAFIRNELLRYLREVGMPYMVILDYDINLGADAAPQADTRRLLRTYLVSYIILAKAQGFERLSGNFIILGPLSRMAEILALEKNPPSILKMLSTKDDKVNAIIDEIKGDEARFNRLFYIKGINTDGNAGEIIESVNQAVSEIGARFGRA